jgi:hypothetical protein
MFGDMKPKTLVAALAIAAFAACARPQVKTDTQDFSTPEGAILSLEDAYRRHDLEAAIACKDFVVEAKLMLQHMGHGMERDKDVVAQTAEVLEASFRKQTSDSWPDLSGLTCSFPKTEPYADSVVSVTERCQLRDGGYSEQRILVAKTGKGWRVLNPLSE